MFVTVPMADKILWSVIMFMWLNPVDFEVYNGVDEDKLHALIAEEDVFRIFLHVYPLLGYTSQDIVMHTKSLELSTNMINLFN